MKSDGLKQAYQSVLTIQRCTQASEFIVNSQVSDYYKFTASLENMVPGIATDEVVIGTDDKEKLNALLSRVINKRHKEFCKLLQLVTALENHISDGDTDSTLSDWSNVVSKLQDIKANKERSIKDILNFDPSYKLPLYSQRDDDARERLVGKLQAFLKLEEAPDIAFIDELIERVNIGAPILPIVKASQMVLDYKHSLANTFNTRGDFLLREELLDNFIMASKSFKSASEMLLQSVSDPSLILHSLETIKTSVNNETIDKVEDLLKGLTSDELQKQYDEKSETFDYTDLKALCEGSFPVKITDVHVINRFIKLQEELSKVTITKDDEPFSYEEEIREQQIYDLNVAYEQALDRIILILKVYPIISTIVYIYFSLMKDATTAFDLYYKVILELVSILEDVNQVNEGEDQ